jgi:hypothetical protein
VGDLILAGEDERKRPESGGDQPGQGNDQEALADSYRLPPSSDPLERRADHPPDNAGDHKRPDRLGVTEREGDRHEHRQAEVLQKGSDEVQAAQDVYAQGAVSYLQRVLKACARPRGRGSTA